MEKVFSLVAIFLFNLSNTLGQDNFSKGIEQLCSELEYEVVKGSFEQLNAPKPIFIESIHACSSEEELSQFAKLDFTKIETVKFAKLKSIKKVDNTFARITYQEWVFTSKEIASTFFNTLESTNQQIAQFCINKGGLMWWYKDQSVFILTSQAYFVTFQYDEIQQILKQE